MTDKNKRIRKSHWKTFFTAIWCVLPIALFGLTAFYCRQRNSIIRDLLQETGSSAEVITYENIESMISVGIAIVTLAVSVWIGLNIYNTITKSDLDERFAERELKLQESINNKLRVASHYSLFLETLQIAHDDNYKSLSDYFYNRFSEFGMESEPCDYLELASIESSHNEMWRAYRENAWRAVNEKAAALKNQLDERIEKAEYKSNKEISERLSFLLEEYYRTRSVSAYYCLLISSENLLGRTSDDAERYWVVMKQQCIHLLNMKRVPVDRKVSDDDIGLRNSFEKGFIAVFYNMYGYTAKKYQKEDARISIFLQNAVTMEPNNATFRHNLGSYYQLCWEKGEDSEKEDKKDYYTLAVNEYDKAKAHDPHDYKAYNNLGAIILKQIEKKYMSRGNEFRSFQEIAKGLKNKSFFTKEDKAECEEQIDQAIVHFQTAIRMAPTFVNCYYNLGKAYFFIYLIQKCMNKDDLLNAANECRIAANLDPNAKGWRYILRNIYELEDIRKAYKINESLNDAGDSIRWKKKFQKQIKKDM